MQKPTGVCEIALLRMTQTVGILACRTPNQGLESSFCFNVAGQEGSPGRSALFTDTGINDFPTNNKTQSGNGLMGTPLNGYLVLQGSIPLNTSQLKHIVNMFARQILDTRWAKYPFSRCPTMSAGSSGLVLESHVKIQAITKINAHE